MVITEIKILHNFTISRSRQSDTWTSTQPPLRDASCLAWCLVLILIIWSWDCCFTLIFWASALSWPDFRDPDDFILTSQESDLTSILLPVMNFNHHFSYEKILHTRLKEWMLNLIMFSFDHLLSYIFCNVEYRKKLKDISSYNQVVSSQSMFFIFVHIIEVRVGQQSGDSDGGLLLSAPSCLTRWLEIAHQSSHHFSSHRVTVQPSHWLLEASAAFWLDAKHHRSHIHR